MLRCAKTLHKEFIGVLYERYAKVPNEDVIIQGLLGRICGYDYNGTSIVFTDIPSIKSYEKRYSEKFTLTNDKKDKKFKSKVTFNDPKLVKGMEAPIEEKVVKEPTNHHSDYRQFSNQEELMEYYKANIKTRYGDKAKGVLIRAKVISKDGWYYETIGSKKVIMQAKDAVQVGLSDINAKKGNKLCRYLVGYDNVRDIHTVRFILIYKKT